jgi:hypothetical protein
MQEVSGGGIFSEITSILVDRAHTKTSRVGEENATLRGGCRGGHGRMGMINQFQSHDLLFAFQPGRPSWTRPKEFLQRRVPTVARALRVELPTGRWPSYGHELKISSIV